MVFAPREKMVSELPARLEKYYLAATLLNTTLIFQEHPIVSTRVEARCQQEVLPGPALLFRVFLFG